MRCTVCSACFVDACVWNRIYSSLSLYAATSVYTRVCACVRFIPLQEHTPNVNMWTVHRDRVMVVTQRELNPLAGNIFWEICNSVISFPMYRRRYLSKFTFSEPTVDTKCLQTSYTWKMLGGMIICR
jgi:hypothetical protein